MKFNRKARDLEKRMLGFKHRVTERIRRICAVVLSASLVVSGFPSISFMALASDDTVDYTFNLNTDDLYSAIATALSEGTTVDKELDFRGEHADEYNELLDPDGTLYELKSLEYEKDKERDKDLQLRVFVRITGDIPLDMGIDEQVDSEDDEKSDVETESFTEYMPDGTEPLIFLLIDRSKDEINAVVRVDDAETEVITVYPASEIPEDGSVSSLKSDVEEIDAEEAEIEISISDEVEEESVEDITEDSDVSIDDRAIHGGRKNGTGGGGGGGASSGRGGYGGRGNASSSEEHDNKDDERDHSPRENDRNNHEGSSSDNNGNDNGNSSSSEGSDSSSEKGDSSSEKSDSSNSSSGSDNAGPDSSDSGSDDSDSSGSDSSSSGSTGNSSSSGSSENSASNNGSSNSSGSNDSSSAGNDSSSSGSTGRNGKSERSSGSSSGSGSSEGAGEKTASVSIHETNLLAAEIASSSNIIKASASNASPSNASPSDATRSINGTVYEPVLLGRRGAVAFETNLQEVGLGYGISLLSADDPVFTVQFWANLNTIYREHHTGDTDLTVIETHTDNGAELPKNEGHTSASYYNTSVIEMTSAGKIDSEKVLTQMYADEEYEFVEESTVHNMNKVEKNSDYQLIEIWKSLYPKDENKIKSTDKSDWTVYAVTSTGDDTYSMEFTNSVDAAADDPSLILVQDDDVFRFVYDTTSAEAVLDANFYDYNIGDGNTYSSASTSGGTWSGSGTAYLYTAEQGINNASNYSGSGTKLAFGNSNAGSGLGTLYWTNNGHENQPNKYNNYGGLNGCTFSLVESLNTTTNTINFADGIIAPNLFGGDAIGKETFSNNQLVFSREGDTYTLAAVSGSNGVGVESLDSFNTTAEEGSAYTNNFWPMDNVSYNGMDVKFGSEDEYGNGYNGTRQYFGNSTASLPLSDDHEEHNSYFGMNFTIAFDYTEDYVGPLEYFFFGDDDMWVFLDEQLVIDIGGVHSTVGEHVDLWDYLQDDTFNEDGIASHTLSVFYTERGASGSTCFIQYTLPEVSSVTPVDDASNLIIEKVVDGPDTDEEFEFTLKLEDENGGELSNQYSCIFTNAAGLFVESKTIKSGSTFTLQDGWNIEIRNLPNGTVATVTENQVNGYSTSYEVGTIQNGEETPDESKGGSGLTAQGIVSAEGTTYIKFINTSATPEKDVQVLEDPDIEGSEYGDSGKQAEVGDTLEYKIDYTNYLDQPVDVTITDVLDEGLNYIENSASDDGIYDETTRTITWVITSVEAGKSGSVTFKATINESALVYNEITNTATVQVDSQEAIDTNPVYTPVPEKDVDIDPDDDHEYGDDGILVGIGDTLTYEVIFRNDYDEEYDEGDNVIPVKVIVTDVLDEGLDIIQSNDSYGTLTVTVEEDGQEVEQTIEYTVSYDEESRALTCTIDNMPAHSKGVLTFQAKVNENATVAGYVENDAVVLIKNDDSVTTNKVVNPVPGKDVDVDSGDGLEYGDSGVQVNVGDTLTYKINFYNDSDDSQDVTITDVLDSGLTYVAGSAACTIYDENDSVITIPYSVGFNGDDSGETGGTLTWELTGMPANTRGIVTFEAVVNDNALEKHEVDNTATVTVGDHSSVTNTVYNPVPEKDVDVDKDSKYGDVGIGVHEGDELTYIIYYFNGYNETATVTITDVLTDGLTYVSSNPEGSYDESTHTITWTIEDVDPLTGGSVTFTATVNKNAFDYYVVDNDAGVNVYVDEDHQTDISTNEVENPLPSLTKEVFEDDYERKDEDIEHEDENGHFEENVDGDGWGTWDDADNNQEVTYHMKIAGIASASDWLTVHDYLQEGLDFEPDTVEVSLYVDGNEEKLTEGTDYTETVISDTAPCTDDGNDGKCTFEVKIVGGILDRITSNEDYLLITYKALTDTQVEDYFDEENGREYVDVILNDAYMETIFYSAAGTAMPYRSIPVDTETDIFAFDVYKYDEDGEPLAGAEFTLSEVRTIDDVQSTFYAKFTTETGDDGNLYYVIYEWDDDEEEAGIFISGEDGMIRIEGLDDDIYTLTETKAPDGYATWVDAITLTIDEDGIVSVSEVTGNDPSVSGGGHVINVENYTIPEKSVDTDGDGVFDDDGESVKVGDTIEYQIDFHNPSDTETAHVTVTDVLDEGLDFVEASDNGSYDEGTRTITWEVDLEPGAEGYVRFTAIVNDDAVVRNELDNTATVKIDSHPEVETDIKHNPVPDKDVDIDPSDGLDYGDNGQQVQVGDTLTYKIEYQNSDDEEATVTITDELDVGLDFVEASDGGTYDEDSRVITWVIEDVAPHSEEGYYVTFTAIVNETALVKNEVDNTATVQVGEHDAQQTRTMYNPIPDKDVDANEDGTYGDSGDKVKVGDALTYIIEYYNGYEDPATITITDVLDAGLDFVEASDGGTYDEASRTITWTIEDADALTAGSVTFTATVNEDALEVNQVDNTATVKINEDPAVDTNTVHNPVPVKDVDIHGDGTFGDNGENVRYGGTLTYKIEFENPDDTSATVTITDKLDEGLDYVENSAKAYIYDEDGNEIEIEFTGGYEYDKERTVTWIIEDVDAQASGCVIFQAKVNSTGRSNRHVDNTATVQVGDHPAKDTNTVSNPIQTSTSSRSGGGGGGGSSSGGGGSSSGGPGDGGSSGEGDSIWDLLPLPQTGQGWAMLIGSCALVVSAMVLIVLLLMKRRESNK